MTTNDEYPMKAADYKPIVKDPVEKEKLVCEFGNHLKTEIEAHPQLKK